jgi:hypothetical protein
MQLAAKTPFQGSAPPITTCPRLSLPGTGWGTGNGTGMGMGTGTGTEKQKEIEVSRLIQLATAASLSGLPPPITNFPRFRTWHRLGDGQRHWNRYGHWHGHLGKGKDKK